MSDFNYRHTMSLVSQRLMKHFSKLDTAGGNGRQAGLVGRPELEAAIKNKSLPLDVRLAAKAALDSFDWFETPEGGQADGLAGFSDFQARMNPSSGKVPPLTPAAVAVVGELLRQNFGHVDGLREDAYDRSWDRGQDGLVDRRELQVFVSNGPTEDVRMAAAAGQELWGILEVASGIGDRDNRLGLSDLDAVVEKGKREIGE